MWLPLVSGEAIFPRSLLSRIFAVGLVVCHKGFRSVGGFGSETQAGNCSIGGFMKNKAVKNKTTSLQTNRRGFLAATGALGALSATGLGIERGAGCGQAGFLQLVYLH